MRHAARRLAPALLLLTLHALPASAQVVIYRCTDAIGAVTLQNGTPCPRGSRQQKRVMEAPPAAPPVAPIVSAPAMPPSLQSTSASPVAPTPPVVEAAPVAAPAPKQPPPPLYECRTWDRQRYLGEVAQPPPRCVPMAVTGLDGQAASAGGSACQMMEDQCQPVPDARLCEAWTQRLHTLESRLTFGDTDAIEPPGDAARVREIVQASTCSD